MISNYHNYIFIQHSQQDTEGHTVHEHHKFKTVENQSGAERHAARLPPTSHKRLIGRVSKQMIIYPRSTYTPYW